MLVHVYFFLLKLVVSCLVLVSFEMYMFMCGLCEVMYKRSRRTNIGLRSRLQVIEVVDFHEVQVCTCGRLAYSSFHLLSLFILDELELL